MPKDPLKRKPEPLASATVQKQYRPSKKLEYEKDCFVTRSSGNSKELCDNPSSTKPTNYNNEEKAEKNHQRIISRQNSIVSTGFQQDVEERRISVIKTLQVVFRECSVLLIVLETLLLLLGYCVLVGLHCSFRYGYLYLRGRHREDSPQQNPPNAQDDIAPLYTVPRGRMSRG